MILPQNTGEIAGIETMDFRRCRIWSQKVEALSPVLLDSVYRKNTWSPKARILLTSFDSGSYRLPDMPLYLRKPDGTVDTFGMKVPAVCQYHSGWHNFFFRHSGSNPDALSGYMGRGPYGSRPVGGSCRNNMAGNPDRKKAQKEPTVFGLSAPRTRRMLQPWKPFEAHKKTGIWKKQNVKQYYTVLTDTVRIYLRDRWGIQAMEQTSAEMMGSLHKKAAPDPLLNEGILGILNEMLRGWSWPNLPNTPLQILKMKHRWTRRWNLSPKRPNRKKKKKINVPLCFWISKITVPAHPANTVCRLVPLPNWKESRHLPAGFFLATFHWRQKFLEKDTQAHSIYFATL